MSKFTRCSERLTDEEMRYYAEANKSRGLVPTGEAIKEEYKSGSCTRVVFRGDWTPYDCMRDCGDYYIVAYWTHYNKISKDLQTIEYDVDDE